jgi:hypothetical protein
MYLMLVGTSAGLAYVLRERKMAFPPTRQVCLEVGDRLLLYITRSVFGNAARDRGRVIATAEVTSPTVKLKKQLIIAGRAYTTECDLIFTGLAPLGEGVILAEIAEDLMAFQPNPKAWAAHIRRSLLQLSSRDFEFILTQLKPDLRSPDETLDAYLERADRLSN